MSPTNGRDPYDRPVPADFAARVVAETERLAAAREPDTQAEPLVLLTAAEKRARRNGIDTQIDAQIEASQAAAHAEVMADPAKRAELGLLLAPSWDAYRQMSEQERAALFADVAAKPDERAFPAPIGEAAMHGLAGELVAAMAPLTEADPAGLLGIVLTVFGALAGHWKTLYQGSQQAGNLYLLLVGDSSIGRKGTAWSVVRECFDAADPGWTGLLVPGLGSGEALIEHLRPPDEPVPGKAHEHRALILESEYSRLLAVMSRQGSALSPVLRDAWDGQPIGRFLARSRSLVLWHHVALVAMITPQELRQVLTTTDQANGFANRHLHVAVQAQRWLAFPESPRAAVTPLLPALRRALAEAQHPGELRWSLDGAMAWEAFYHGLRGARREPGLLGAMLARAEAQVARLALVYALLERSAEVDAPHLEAALAFWEYVVRSTAWVYGRSTGSRDADALLEILRGAGWLAREEIRNELGLRKASDINDAVATLDGLGLIERRRVGSGGRGRPREEVRATE